jgi:hypothetical protein
MYLEKINLVEKINLDWKEEKELGMLRIISELTLVIEEELCVCFIDWQKAKINPDPKGNLYLLLIMQEG